MYTIKEEKNYHTEFYANLFLVSLAMGQNKKTNIRISPFYFLFPLFFLSYFLLTTVYLNQIKNKMKGMLYLSAVGKYQLDIC